MKKIIYKITAFFLTILVLFSSSFIVIDEHYCEGKLEHFSLFGKADVCEMDMATCAMENHNSSVVDNDCCLNITEIKSSNIFEKTTNNINFPKESNILIGFFNKSSFNLFTIVFKSSIYYKNYIPPLITEDIFASVQCFRL